MHSAGSVLDQVSLTSILTSSRTGQASPTNPPTFAPSRTGHRRGQEG